RGSASSPPSEVPSPVGSVSGSQPRSHQPSSASPRGPTGTGPGSLVLPSGSVVGIALAAGIAAAVATARLRIRRRYRPLAPQAGKAAATPAVGPTTRGMLAACSKQAGDNENASPAMPGPASFMFAG